MSLEETIDDLFDRLDIWRHLPNYQLERRVDIFFSLYLTTVLSAKYGLKIDERIIPELPLHLGTLFSESSDNRSFKVDYFCLSADKTKGFLVELKTDQSSRRPKQDEYLEAAQNIGLPSILEGLKAIFLATRAKRKYFYLFLMLEELGLVSLPQKMQSQMQRSKLTDVTTLIKTIEIAALDPGLEIVYVQPSDRVEEETAINFDYFAKFLRGIDDPLARRFADSLNDWADSKAGSIE